MLLLIAFHREIAKWLRNSWDNLSAKSEPPPSQARADSGERVGLLAQQTALKIDFSSCGARRRAEARPAVQCADLDARRSLLGLHRR
jgi:hypothetical protein